VIEPVVGQAITDPVAWLNVVIAGLGTAGVYVMIASGLSLIFGLMGVLNFAHGTFTTVGAYVGGILVMTFLAENASSVLGAYVPFLVAVVLVGVVLALMGAVTEVGLIRRLYDRPPIDQILLTFGIALVIRELLYIFAPLWGADPTQDWKAVDVFGPPLLESGFTVDVFGLSIQGLRVAEFLLGAVVVVAVWLFLTRTRYGLFIRAGSEDDEMAEALGINVRRVFTVVFAIGIGLAGMAGTFLVWETGYAVTPLMGAEKALLPAFIVVVVGGLGTFKGTVVASVVAGMFFEFGIYLNTNYLTEFSELPNMALFILLVGILILRPQGLFGQEEVGGH